MKRGSFLLAAIAVVLLSACGPASAVPTAVPTQAAAATPAVTATPDVTLAAVMVFERSGAFQGITEQWSVYETGEVRSSNGTKFKVRPADMREKLNAITQLGFFDLADSYGQSSTCNDCITYRLTIHNGGVTKTVTAVQGAPDTPAKVLQIMDDASELVSGQMEK